MERKRKLIVENEMLSCSKGYTPNQLKAFYFIMYKFKTENIFSNVNGEYNGETHISICIDEFAPIYKEKKLSRHQLISLLKDMGMFLFFYSDKGITGIPIFMEIHYKYNSEYIEFYLNSEIIPMLVDNDCNFSEIILDNMFKLNKKYSGNMYELYCRFKNQKIYKMPIDKLSYFFDVPKKYSSSEMERAVLNTSIKEIKSKLGISITYTKEKKNGKITHYVFKFEKRNFDENK